MSVFGGSLQTSVYTFGSAASHQLLVAVSCNRLSSYEVMIVVPLFLCITIVVGVMSQAHC